MRVSQDCEMCLLCYAPDTVYVQGLATAALKPCPSDDVPMDLSRSIMSVYILTYKTGIKFPAHVVIMRKCDITDTEVLYKL